MKRDRNSPCINVCILDNDKICIGCFRSEAEIAKWSVASKDEQTTILQNIQDRKNLKLKDKNNYYGDPF